MEVPEALIRSLERLKCFDRESFLEAHEREEKITSIRINPFKPPRTLPANNKVPWTNLGYYLEERPSFTFDPLFHAGAYYVQEASSMFLEQAILQKVGVNQPIKVLDLCASPGGKSTHLQSLLHPQSLIVSNEVIRSRVTVLRENMVKWGGNNFVITHNDPRDFSKLRGYFDLLIVDAPCSGSGLIRRDPMAANEWSEQNVLLCSQRQQRILADVWPSLRAGGVIIYSTCSYSPEEDEEIVQWIKEQLGASILGLETNEGWQVDVGPEGFRFWPGKTRGEGFFLAILQKTFEEESLDIRLKKRPSKLTSKEEQILAPWLSKKDLAFIRNGQTVYGWPEHGAGDHALLLQEMRVILSGLQVGEIVNEKLIPSHALALSTVLEKEVPRVEMNKEMAIRFLQKKDTEIQLPSPGWKLASYQEKGIGWMNVLKNRINNYYPVDLRIRKEKDT